MEVPKILKVEVGNIIKKMKHSKFPILGNIYVKVYDVLKECGIEEILYNKDITPERFLKHVQISFLHNS